MAGKPQTNDAGKAPERMQLHELSDAQLAKFELDGSLPSREPDAAAEKAEAGAEAGKDAEAAAAEAVESAASTDASSQAAPESADPGKKPQKHGQKKNAGDRAAEVEREAAEAEQRLEAALARRRRASDALKAVEREETSDKAGKKPGEAAAPATDPKEPGYKKWLNAEGAPKAPSIDDPKFQKIDDYLAAMNEHSVAMAHFIAEKIAEEKFGSLYEQRAGKDREAFEADQRFLAQVEEAEARVSKQLEADPGIIDRIDPKFRALNPSDRRGPDEPMTVAHFIKDQVTFNCKNTLPLSEWLTKDGNRELRRIGAMRPEQIIRELAIQDSRFDPADGDEEEAQDTGADARPHSRVSKAPPPAPALGKKAAAAKDPTKAAIEANDFDAFNDLETKREMAESGARR